MIIKICMRTQIKIILDMHNLLQLNGDFFSFSHFGYHKYTVVNIFEGFAKL
jgi:hypothetical protein